MADFPGAPVESSRKLMSLGHTEEHEIEGEQDLKALMLESRKESDVASQEDDKASQRKE